MRVWIHVETFDLGDPDEKAKKVLEEGSEACEAARLTVSTTQMAGGA